MSTKEIRSIKSISPYLLKKEDMTLEDFVKHIKALLLKKGSVTLDTGYQWFTDGMISPYKGYALNISKGYNLAGIENKTKASQLAIEALSKAGIKIITLPAQTMFYYLKLEEG